MLRGVKAEDAKKIGKECGLFTLKKTPESPFFGHPENLGLMGAEIQKINSEQNKISSTLFKISSELIFLSPSYLHAFLGYISLPKVN